MIQRLWIWLVKSESESSEPTFSKVDSNDKWTQHGTSSLCNYFCKTIAIALHSHHSFMVNVNSTLNEEAASNEQNENWIRNPKLFRNKSNININTRNSFLLPWPWPSPSQTQAHNDNLGFLREHSALTLDRVQCPWKSHISSDQVIFRQRLQRTTRDRKSVV